MHCAAVMFEGIVEVSCGVGINDATIMFEEEGLRWRFGIVVDEIIDCVMFRDGIVFVGDVLEW